MKTSKRALKIFILLTLPLKFVQAQNDYSIDKLTVINDTINFIIKDNFKNLITGKVTPVISKDSLLSLISLYDGIETTDGINKRLYANVARRFDSATASFIIKNGQKYVYQYNDGIGEILNNGSGLSKIFYEPLRTHTIRVFKDSILVSRYEVFENDTLHHINFYDESTKLIFDQIVDILNNKLNQEKYFEGDTFFVIDENNLLTYIITSKRENDGKRSIKKVKMTKRNRYYINNVPKKNGKTIIPLLTR